MLSQIKFTKWTCKFVGMEPTHNTIMMKYMSTRQNSHNGPIRKLYLFVLLKNIFVSDVPIELICLVKSIAHKIIMSDKCTPSQQSMRRALAKVTPPDRPVLPYAHSADDRCTCIRLFNDVQQNVFTLPSLGTDDRNATDVDNPNFIPQRGFYTSPPVVDTFSDDPPFLRLERRDDNGAITNRDVPVATGPPPTIAARNPPQQVHCQNELVDSIPERPTHASVMSNERWGASTNSQMMQRMFQCIYSVSCAFAVCQEHDALATWSRIFLHVAPPAMRKNKET